MNNASGYNTYVTTVAGKVSARSPLMKFAVYVERAKAECPKSLRGLITPTEIADEVSKLAFYREYVGGSVDLVKDGLIGLEENDLIRRLDDDLFFVMRDRVQNILFPGSR